MTIYNIFLKSQPLTYEQSLFSSCISYLLPSNFWQPPPPHFFLYECANPDFKVSRTIQEIFSNWLVLTSCQRFSHITVCLERPLIYQLGQQNAHIGSLSVQQLQAYSLFPLLSSQEHVTFTQASVQTCIFFISFLIFNSRYSACTHVCVLLMCLEPKKVRRRHKSL